MPCQILNRAQDKTGVVTERAQSLIAEMTEKRANLAGGVIVVNMQEPVVAIPGRRVATHGAEAILSRSHAVELRCVDPVKVPEIVLARPADFRVNGLWFKSMRLMDERVAGRLLNLAGVRVLGAPGPMVNELVKAEKFFAVRTGPENPAARLNEAGLLPCFSGFKAALLSEVVVVSAALDAARKHAVAAFPVIGVKIRGLVFNLLADRADSLPGLKWGNCRAVVAKMRQKAFAVDGRVAVRASGNSGQVMFTHARNDSTNTNHKASGAIATEGEMLSLLMATV